MKKILIFIQSETQFNELKRTAKVLSPFYEFILCFELSNEVVLKKLQSYCKERAWRYLTIKTLAAGVIIAEYDWSPGDSNSFGNNVISSSPNKFSLVKKTLYWLMNYLQSIRSWQNMLSETGSFISILASYRQQLILMKMILNKNNIGLILLGEDGLGMNPTLLKAAKDMAVPVLVTPYEYSTVVQIIASIERTTNYESIYGQSRFWNKVAFFFYGKKWSRVINDKKILRMPGYWIMAQELFSCAPKLPWTVHGGSAKFIAAESPQMIEHYLREQIDPKKLVLTGALAFDELFTSFREKKNYQQTNETSHATTRDSLRILCAFPGDYVSEKTQYCEFTSYPELLDFWISTLQDLVNVNVVFQVHPAVSQEYRDYIQSKGIILKTEDVTKLIAECDILVTSVSSIIRLAIACKKPVINYDVYNFNYPDYASIAGVVTINNKSEFKNITQKITQNQDTYQHYVNLQAAGCAQWGNIDGKTSTRVLKLIDEMMVDS